MRTGVGRAQAAAHHTGSKHSPPEDFETPQGVPFGFYCQLSTFLLLPVWPRFLEQLNFFFNTLYAVPERALQIATDVGRWCSGWASGVLGAVDRWLSGLASNSSAQAVIAQMPRDPGGETRFPSGRRRSTPMWVGDVVVARVGCWVVWVADCLVQLAA